MHSHIYRNIGKSGLGCIDKLFSEEVENAVYVAIQGMLLSWQMQNISNVLECLIAYFFTLMCHDLKVFLTSMFVLFFQDSAMSATVPFPVDH